MSRLENLNKAHKCILLLPHPYRSVSIFVYILFSFVRSLGLGYFALSATTTFCHTDLGADRMHLKGLRIKTVVLRSGL